MAEVPAAGGGKAAGGAAGDDHSSAGLYMLLSCSWLSLSPRTALEAEYSVRLSRQPAARADVLLSEALRVGERTKLQLEPSRLTFSPADWAVPQRVTVRASSSSPAAARCDLVVQHSIVDWPDDGHAAPLADQLTAFLPVQLHRRPAVAAVAFGCNDSDQLGRPPARRPAPAAEHTPASDALPPAAVQLADAAAPAAIACGSAHSALCTADGRLYTWGAASCGQLGRLPPSAGGSSLPPQAVESLATLRVVGVACGDAHTVAVTEDGRAWAVGSMAHGALGLGTLDELEARLAGCAGMTRDERSALRRAAIVCRPQPLPLPPRLSVAAVACGASHTLLLTRRGSLYATGDNAHGQCGVASLADAVLSPSAVCSFADRVCTFIAAGGDSSAAIDSSGQLYTWGAGRNGVLGTGARLDVTRAKAVDGCDNVSRIAMGACHAVALSRIDANVFGWGDGSSGQLGALTMRRLLRPALLTVGGSAAAGTRVCDVACGDAFTVLLCEDGTLLTMGDVMSSGETTLSAQTIPALRACPVVAVAAGGRHTVLLTQKALARPRKRVDALIKQSSARVYRPLSARRRKRRVPTRRPASAPARRKAKAAAPAPAVASDAAPLQATRDSAPAPPMRPKHSSDDSAYRGALRQALEEMLLPLDEASAGAGGIHAERLLELQYLLDDGDAPLVDRIPDSSAATTRAMSRLLFSTDAAPRLDDMSTGDSVLSFASPRPPQPPQTPQPPPSPVRTTASTGMRVRRKPRKQRKRPVSASAAGRSPLLRSGASSVVRPTAQKPKKRGLKKGRRKKRGKALSSPALAPKSPYASSHSARRPRSAGKAAADDNDEERTGEADKALIAALVERNRELAVALREAEVGRRALLSRLQTLETELKHRPTRPTRPRSRRRRPASARHRPQVPPRPPPYEW